MITYYKTEGNTLRVVSEPQPGSWISVVEPTPVVVQPTPVVTAQPVVPAAPVVEPVVGVNQPLVFNATKETNLNAALGEVA